MSNNQSAALSQKLPANLAIFRSKKFRRAVYAFAGFVAGTSVGVNILAYRHAHAMMHFTQGATRTEEPERLSLGQKFKVLMCGVSIPRPQSRVSVNSLGPGCQSVTLNVKKGITLGAWYCPGTNLNQLVILFHGYTSEKTGMLKEARTFLKMGASVMLVDFRGSGESSQSYTTIGYDEAEDVAAAARYAQTHFHPGRLILYGQSMGAVAILRAVHDFDVRPDGIIVESVFDRMLSTVRHRFEAMGVPSFPGAELLVFWGGRQAGFNGFRHNPVDYAASVNAPILFLHGTEDPRARIEEARRVYEAVPGAKRFVEFAGNGHQSGVVRFRAAWTQAVQELLTEAQKKQPIFGN